MPCAACFAITILPRGCRPPVAVLRRCLRGVRCSRSGKPRLQTFSPRAHAAVPRGRRWPCERAHRVVSEEPDLGAARNGGGVGLVVVSPALRCALPAYCGGISHARPLDTGSI